MRTMLEGGRRELIIPPFYGYGELGTKRVPPDSTLWFDVELIRVGSKHV